MKRGYLGIFEGAYLAGRSAGFRHALEDMGVANDTVPLEKLIYVSAFQGGVGQFITPYKPGSSDPLDRFIAGRLSEPKATDAQLLERLLSLRVEDHDEGSEARGMAFSFVHDLLVAMDHDASVINVSGIPTAAEVREEFRPDAAVAICTILSAIQSANELLPAPSVQVDRDMVRRFRDLLDSDVYGAYVEAHERIERNAKESSLRAIRQTGARLLEVSKGALAPRRVSVNFISMVPQIVDAAFGKLPGTLADFAGELAAKLMDDRRNLIIYQFEDWANEYTRAILARSGREGKN